MILGTFKRRAAPFLSGEKHTFSTVLLSILMKAYGTAVLEWDGATIQMETERDFGITMPRKVYDQLLALITALTTDLVYTDVEIFDEVCNALCRKGLGSYRQVPPALDVAWAVTEIEIADPEPVSRNPKDRWDDSIKRYIRVVLNDEGISFAPKTLDFVKSLAPNTRETSDPALFASSWLSKQEASDEIDAQVEDLTKTLLLHLKEAGLGAPVSVKFASVPEIVEVDGGKIRDTINNDFTGGSHSEALPEVPDDEVWVEKSLSEDDQKKIVLHEVVERSLMKQDGTSFDKAHETASRMEAKARGNPKSAEWTSPANQAAHVLKHSPEFGSPEGYLAAEAEHAGAPAGDEVARDIRCKIRPDGTPDCTMSYHSPSRGTLHVKRLKDGKTVTLYKVTA
jgi:hypothetical protein